MSRVGSRRAKALTLVTSQSSSDPPQGAGDPPQPSSLGGRYQLLGSLGQGGMADVYLAVARGPLGFNKLVVLKRLRAEISYTFVPDRTGGRVVISTASKQALAAVHDFLRYQMREHHQ